jgi:hypothetical protein
MGDENKVRTQKINPPPPPLLPPRCPAGDFSSGQRTQINSNNQWAWSADVIGKHDQQHNQQP